MSHPSETLFWRQLFTDWESLRGYLVGNPPQHEAIVRRAFVAERVLDHRLADHYYKNIRDLNFNLVNGLQELLLGGLRAISEYFLIPADDRLVVARERFEQWQHHLPRFSPLVIVSFGLYARHGAPGSTLEDHRNYVQRYIEPQFRYSALPTVHEPALETLISEDGLWDLHIHLNGTTEVDKIWLDALRDPDGFRNNLIKTVKRGGKREETLPREEVLEQYQQIEAGLTPSELCWRIRRARVLRWAIAGEVLADVSLGHSICGLASRNSTEVETIETTQRLYRHPVEEFIWSDLNLNELGREALWLIRTFERLERQPSEDLAASLHCYLLMSGSLTPLCVQQQEQFGFDQFQKITWNETRKFSEQGYKERFEQISFSKDGDLRLIEGRFAPLKGSDASADQLRRILGGFAEFHNQPFDLSVERPIELQRRLDLRLVAHFIKRNDLSKLPDEQSGHFPCRYHKLRGDLSDQLRSLNSVRAKYPVVTHYLTGIDAAANELHTPPEVFAPVFRACREAKLERFTYHVGEDFEHLLGGIRAVQEALVFLDLGPGDRIGHGTAVGIEPTEWLNSYPNRMIRRKGDWLDDLVFAHEMLLGRRGSAGIREKLSREIAALSGEIYGESFTPRQLANAARLRHLDPMIACDALYNPEDNLSEFALREQRLVVEAEREDPEAFKLFCRYHDCVSVRRSLQPIEIQTKLLDAVTLEYLQRKVLEEIIVREVVLEALPTSNLRISIYDDYRQHHLFKWLGLRGRGPCPRVCLGTDDPGIFATNLRNEFAHILRELCDSFKLSEEKAMVYLRALNNNGARYAFKDNCGPSALQEPWYARPLRIGCCFPLVGKVRDLFRAMRGQH